jgi:steroid delta-isomerase-like uncharacterized protein
MIQHAVGQTYLNPPISQNHRNERRMRQLNADTPLSLEIISQYAAAIAARDSARMHALRAPDFVLDTVNSDAFQGDPLSAKGTQAFWPAWFAGFPEMDFEVTRTIAAECVVVTQWSFAGVHAGPLDPPIFERRIDPTGRVVRFRGVSIYDVSEGLIQRETMYIDLATIMVELGIGL